MPQMIKVHKYKDFVNYTKNFKVLFYRGTTLAVLDQYEEFFINIICDSQEDKTVKLEKVETLIALLMETFKESEYLKTLWIRTIFCTFQLEKSSIFSPRPQKTSCVRFIINPDYHVAISPKAYGLIEKIDHMLFEFIEKNKFKVFPYESLPNFTKNLALDRIFNPHNPDPNYIFFLKENEKPYCEF